MTRSFLAALSALALLVASCSGLPAFAQNLQANQLPVRGAVQSTDTIPCQPANANLEGCAPSAIATYVQQTAAAGTSGQVQINNGGAFAGVTVSGDGTLSSSGALTVTKSNGTAFGTFAFQNYASLPSASGSPPIAAGTVFPCIPASALDGCTGAQLIAYVSNGPIGADPTGAADSTSALQSWLNAGSPGTIPCGTYKTTATLTMETAANNGQQVRGSGAGSSAGGGACRTVIKPTSAVTTALIIDGTPISAWVMGIGLHDLVFDMTSMTDASTTSAIKQVQAYDVSYERVRVINDGTSKRGWLFNAGAYTTSLLNTQANIIDMEGSSSGNAVTTITMLNSDIGRLIANYAYNVSFVGGAIQPIYNSSTMTPIYLAANAATTPSGLTNGSGIYVIPAIAVTNSDSFTITGDLENGGGFPSTYNDGTHGTLNAYPVVEVPSTWTRVSLLPGQLGGLYLYDLSSSTFSIGANAGGGSPYNQIDAPTAFSGGLSARSGSSITTYSDNGVTQTSQVVGSSGAATYRALTLQPGSDGEVFQTKSAGGTAYVGCYTSGGGSCIFQNSMGLAGYYDTGSTLGWSLTMPSVGNGLLNLYSTGNTSTITLTGANGSGTFNGRVRSNYVFDVSGTDGVTCTGTPTSSFAATGGIVTHC